MLELVFLTMQNTIWIVLVITVKYDRMKIEKSTHGIYNRKLSCNYLCQKMFYRLSKTMFVNFNNPGCKKIFANVLNGIPINIYFFFTVQDQWEETPTTTFIGQFVWQPPAKFSTGFASFIRFGFRLGTKNFRGTLPP